MSNHPTLDVVFASDRSTVHRLLREDRHFKSCPDAVVIVQGKVGKNEDANEEELGSKGVYKAELTCLLPPWHGVVQRDVVVKWALDYDAVAQLRHEMALYTERLRSLQGKYVPHFYGFYVMNSTDAYAGCIVLELLDEAEWDPNPGRRARRRERNKEEEAQINRKQMEATYKIHEVGVVHNNLVDGRHILILKDGTVRIVDFSVAALHECATLEQGRRNPSTGSLAVARCGELREMEDIYGRQ